MPKITVPPAPFAQPEPTVKVILAEADAAEVIKIESQIDARLHGGIKVARNYTQLVERVSIEQPELVLLSRIDNSNFAEICKNCRKYRQDLPIFLLSKTAIISKSFRNLVKTVGISDVIPQAAPDLDRLLSPYLPIEPTKHTPKSTISGEVITASLTEIASFSRHYFGDLTLGNYWRKTHDLTIERCPSLRYWSVNRFGKIEVEPLMLDKELTDREIENIRVWVQAFFDECERSVPNFRSLIDKTELSSNARYLIHDPNSC